MTNTDYWVDNTLGDNSPLVDLHLHIKQFPFAILCVLFIIFGEMIFDFKSWIVDLLWFVGLLKHTTSRFIVNFSDVSYSFRDFFIFGDV